MILHFPKPVLTSQSIEPTYFDSHDPLSREELKALMKSKGESDLSSGVVRRPFAGQLVDVPSPEDPNVIFQCKRCTVADNIRRQNLSSTIRYVSEDGGNRMVTERDYPMGDMRFQTVVLGLAGWNLVTEDKAPIALTETNIENYLSPAEFEVLYDKIIEINPMWGGGAEDSKKS